ncbi:GNAT family N-acetyltransferase [Kribbella deserti]|uniref:GNAT family N-acetyltransferase n=1 Tax=Kribbella deserti TaxID=1926257 RepID=A0ABV6QP65_9ACTN
MTFDPWPFRHLVLRTPRLELRPDDDAGLLELNEEALAGVYEPGTMPFSVPWNEAPPEVQGRQTFQHYWAQRAALGPGNWTINFLIRLDGKVIGAQGLTGKDFGVTREVSSGSWIARRLQGQGLGTEMRAAVLLFAFDHLGAQTARSEAFTDNPASQSVSRKLGYQPDGTMTVDRMGKRATQVRLLLPASEFVRPEWQLEVSGLEDCLPLLDPAEQD